MGLLAGLANLHGAQLLRSNLAHVQLNKADLRNADLSDAKLAGTDLNNADLEQAKLDGTILCAEGIGDRSNTKIFTQSEVEDTANLAFENPMPAIRQSLNPPNPEYPLNQCAEETGFEQAELEFWVQAIERKGQAILHGPPGTGKTYTAEQLAKHLIGGGRGFKELVQCKDSGLGLDKGRISSKLAT